MRIIDLHVTCRTIALKKPFKTALRTATEIDSIEITIELENGMIGMGSAAPTWVITGDSTESIQAALSGPIRNVLLNKNIEDFRSLLSAIQTCCIGNTSAKAAADIALHDAYSKWLGVPLYRYFGNRKPLTTCMTVGVDLPGIMAKEAIEQVKNGFGSLKLKVGSNPELDIARVTAIRDAVPSDVKLRLDANQGWSPKQAVRLIGQMERENLNIEFIEQPVLAHDKDGLKYVTDRVSIPIMADESIFSPHDALQLASGKYADLLNIKLMKCGGLSNAWKIADIAQAAGVRCMVGSMMESGQSVAAAAHFASAHPNVVYFDLDAPLRLTEDAEFMAYADDEITLSSKPGISNV